jgi:hypothetical protein
MGHALSEVAAKIQHGVFMSLILISLLIYHSKDKRRYSIDKKNIIFLFA